MRYGDVSLNYTFSSKILIKIISFYNYFLFNGIDDSIASLRRQMKISKIIAKVNKPSCKCNLSCNIAIDIVKVKAMSIIALTLDE